MSRSAHSGLYAALLLLLAPVAQSAPATQDNSSVFGGFISAASITSITFRGGQYGPAVDNLQFGTAAVPELSTCSGFGSLLAFGGLALARQRKPARQAA